MRNGIFMRAAGTYGPSEPGPVAGQAISLFARADTASQGKESMGPASRRSPPCAKGGQHGNAMQGGIDSTQLPGRYQVPGVGMVSQVPSIPQSAFADSSLCTREVRWPDGHISLCRFASNWPFLWHLVPVGPRREAGKRSGKNLVFPRKVRWPDSHTFSALANTTGKGKESYGSSVTLARRFRRREETWDSLPRREGSGFRVVF